MRGSGLGRRLAFNVRGGLGLLLVPVVECRTGKDSDLPVAHALILITFLAQRDVAEQTGENRAVNRGVIRVALI